MAFKIPILLLTFTRLDTTIRVFERIKEQKPKYLFIASDGPRANNDQDVSKINAVKEYILNGIDWDCEVKTLFREHNMGCGLAVSSGISWFFEQVEYGIILEDDCLPHPDFFSFCEENLEYYKNDDHVWAISGTNLQGGHKRGHSSYYFSNYGGIWGWATWSKAWKSYDYHMKDLDKMLKKNFLSKIFNDKNQQAFWAKTLTKAKNIDTWDYQWHYNTWLYNGISIVPNVNLIDNIGFGNAGTHTMNKPLWYDRLTLGTNALGYIKHPANIMVDEQADNFLFENCYKPASVISRVKSKISKLLKN
ncbi:nucleotide-diphospho-sugar transferase [Mucilaginibacter rubeus]|uniref:Nucleotide-diphospho-sugar transferase n=1 Tax=Mucilaginibacter rubeus TaxID=2027860 RepID=A0A5C1HXE2_9SPHI|nr:nucleotide-diphospho-sugar transferase [Mucilaginibacter rubeus]QEM10526.1 nucleotide-diphospho-sugar transferase [Mucilaginibacter rubeus]